MEVSVDLACLSEFIRVARQSNTDLTGWMNPAVATIRAHAFESGSGVDASGTVPMSNISPEYAELIDFVQLVHDAAEAADGRRVGSVVTLDNAVLVSALQTVAKQRSIDLNALLGIDAAATDQFPAVGTIPPSSGFVNDPVATATAALVVSVEDFVVPPRLAVLACLRSYASVSQHVGAFGRGWWWWSDVSLSAADNLGWRALTLHDGRLVDLTPTTEGAWHHLGHDVRLTGDEDTTVLDWGRTSSRPYERWTLTKGRLTSVCGPTIGTTTIQRDASGRVSSLAHSGGAHVTVRWSNERIVGLVDHHGRSATFDYDDAGNLRTATNPTGTTRYELDDRGRILRIVDADGVIVESMRYDDDDRVVEQTSATGLVTTFSRGAALTTVVGDANGRTLSRYVHDEFGRVVTTTAIDGVSLTRKFDHRGRIVAQTDASGGGFTVDILEGAEDQPGLDGSATVVEHTTWNDGRRETRRYDAWERLTSITSPGGSVHFTYPHGSTGDACTAEARTQALLVATITDDDGATTSFQWDDGLLVGLTDADGVVVHLDYDPDGIPIAAVDGAGRRTTFTPHPSGTWAGVVLADGTEMRRELDDAGRLLSWTNATGSTVTATYTAAGRLASITDALGATTTVHYAANGLCREVVGADGSVTTIEHDADQHIVGLTMTDGQTIHLGRDAWGRIQSLTADGFGTWQRVDDSDGQPAAIIDPLGRISSSIITPVVERRDGAGRVTRQRVASHWTESVYSPAGRLLEQRTPGGVRRQRYDGTGALVGIDIGRGWWTITNDDLGRPTSLTSPEGRRRTVGYSPSGQMTRLTLGPIGWNYAYDANGRMTSVGDDRGRLISYRYDRNGRLAGFTEMSGATTTYDHGPGGWLRAVTDTSGHQRRWDRPGRRRVRRTDEIGRVTTIDMDEARQAVRLTMPDGRLLTPKPAALEYRLDEPLEPDLFDGDGLLLRRSSRHGTTTFERDPATGLIVTTTTESAAGRERTELRRDTDGRVISRITNGQVSSFAYDAGGRLAAMDVGDQRWTWTYDDVGRLVAEQTPDGPRTYTYDAAGQLTEVDEPAGVTTFHYDGDGRRLSASGVHPATYEWSDWRLVAFTHGGRRHTIDDGLFGLPLGIDGTDLTWQRGAEPAYCLNVAPTTVLGPWGEPLTADIANHPFGGVSVDGLVLIGARAYHPATRQFLSRDPLEPVPGETSANWRYAYAGCDPLNRLDLFGLQGSPLSTDEFERLRSQYTGAQWGNIAAAGLTVVAIAVAVGTMGAATPLIGVIAFGAISAGGIEATKQGVNVLTGKGSAEWDPIAIARATAIGALTGPVARIPGVSALAGRGPVFAAGVDVAGNAGGEAVNQLYDLTNLPGSDHSYDFDAILVAGASAAGGHALSHGIGAANAHFNPPPTHVTTGQPAAAADPAGTGTAGSTGPAVAIPDPAGGAPAPPPAPGGTTPTGGPPGATPDPALPSAPQAAASSPTTTAKRYIMSENGIIHERGVSPYYERTAAVVGPKELTSDSLEELKRARDDARMTTAKIKGAP